MHKVNLLEMIIEAKQIRVNSEKILKNVCNHIQNFPANVSHFIRKYNPNLQLYKEKYSE